MSALLEQVDTTIGLVAAHALVDDLQAADCTALGDAAVIESLRELERLHRRLDHVGYSLIAEADARGLPGVHGARSMTAFLRGLLRIESGDAHARVAAAAAAGPRRGMDGVPLSPIFEHVAAAQATGSISERHARVVERTVDALPDEAQAAHGAQVEADLVAHARSFDPTDLAKIAARVLDWYDPDGLAEREKYRDRQRELTVRQRPDGSATLRGACTAELAERLLVVFDSLAAPVPGPGGERDPRSGGQRRHDALTTALRTLQTSGNLPTAGGVGATVVVTMTERAYRTGRGSATLGHGALVSSGAALAMGGGDLRLLAVATDALRGITAHSHTHRLFTESQRLAIAARDGGCSFPGCDVAPGWCQTHHVVDYADGGPTSVDNGTLLCRYHHTHFHQLGWTCQMVNGHPYWRPPGWHDRTRTPIRNRRLHLGPSPGE